MLKNAIYSSIKKTINSIKLNYLYLCLKYKELLNLKKKIKIGNYNVEYTNWISIFYEYQDIFINKIYQFESDNDAPLIIDAGGCIGMSVFYFKNIYPKSKIIVFEPDPTIFSILENNIKNNKLANIELINAGLGKNNSAIKFYPDGSDGGTFYEGNKHQAVDIRMLKLSDYIKSPIDFLKMNIEGSEGEVIEEIQNKLNYVQEIIFEYHSFYNLPQNLGNILNILDKANFRFLVTDATNAKIPVPFKLIGNYRFFNLIYAKNENNT